MNSSTAPIALFTFNRPEHTRQTLESLAQNPEFESSLLFIYCDGARHEGDADSVDATRKLVREWPHSNKTLIERERNWGLANSVIAGVTNLCERFGRVIVVEDDLVVSPAFLNYLNSALKRYAEEPQVMQISGYMFPTSYGGLGRSILLPITSTWGWATWNRAWKEFVAPGCENIDFLKDPRKRETFNLHGAYPYTRRLKQQLKGRSDSWGIRWYLSVFNCGGLVVYPNGSLVQNIGHDGSGTHCKVELKSEMITESPIPDAFSFPEDIVVDEEHFRNVKAYLRKDNRFMNRLTARLRTEFRKLFHK